MPGGSGDFRGDAYETVAMLQHGNGKNLVYSFRPSALKRVTVFLL